MARIVCRLRSWPLITLAQVGEGRRYLAARMRCATRYIVGIILIVPLRLGSRLIFALLHRPPVEISTARSMAIGPRRAAAPEKLCPGAAAMAELFRSPCRVKVPPSNRAFRARRKSHRRGPAGFTKLSTTLARRDAERVRLFTRHGTDFTARYPKIAAAVESLPVRSCALDGEAIVVNTDGLSVFDLIRYRYHDYAAVLCAFDLIELEGEDLRRQPIERRKAVLANLLRDTRDGIAFNEHFEGDGRIVFEHACALGCEGIVSKRLGSPYRAGRVDHWLKIKNPAAPAVRREAEEDWATNDGRADDESEPESMSVKNEQSSRTGDQR
jgi:bifunctional non-homologous end joining protein LigD